ncbi:MAG: YkvA family protein [Anaerolineae bacterium]|nr:YkvA family protein [Thermoflexales bacterium]MDW8395729.1 YkvA family protein [Anaerolineae bacterium]
MLINRIRLVLRLMGDKRVPVTLKLLPIGAVAYAFWPVDLLPDMVPGLGQLDDLGVVLAGLEAFIALCPAAVVAEHVAAIEGGRRARSPEENVVDGEWRVKS